MKLNKGEWSELIAVLHFLIEQRLHVVNDNLDEIENTNYGKIESVTFIGKDKLTFLILDEFITVQKNNTYVSKISIKEVKRINEVLIKELERNSHKGGAFDIPEVTNWLDVISESNVFKSPANEKADISIKLLDILKNDLIDLTYSIKSSLGSPSTILNASKHTDFKYRINEITHLQVNEINSIHTREKLIDRFNYLIDHKINYTFESAVSQELSDNLNLIDPELEDVLAEALLLSYSQNNTKDLLNLFNQCLNNNANKALFLLGSLLEGISFGFFPSEKWNGKSKVSGGLILVTLDKGTVVLDKTYYKNELLKYMTYNSKLDSPSSTRYNMLNIEKDDMGHYFTLNLQIRYRK